MARKHAPSWMPPAPLRRIPLRTSAAQTACQPPLNGAHHSLPITNDFRLRIGRLDIRRSVSFDWDDGCRLNLNRGAFFQQVSNDDQRHCREVPAKHAAIGLADFSSARDI